MTQILEENILFNNWFVVEEAKLQTGNDVVSRMRLNQPDASAVLVYNASSGNFILTKQFSYAIHAKTPEPILEVAAGRRIRATLRSKTR